jgi:hypothetical protein
MNQGDGSSYFVDVLAARPARAGKNFFEVFRAQAQTSHAFR